MKTVAELDAAIEETRRDSSDCDRTNDLILTLLSGAGLQDNVADLDIRVASLLRVAAIDHYTLYEHPKRRQIINFVTERFNERRFSISANYGIDAGGQGDEVCRRLGRIADDASTGLTEALESYGGLETLGQFANVYSKR